MKVPSEVRVELPLGRSIRRSCGDIGSVVAGCSESTSGGVQDETVDFKVSGS